MADAEAVIFEPYPFPLTVREARQLATALGLSWKENNDGRIPDVLMVVSDFLIQTALRDKDEELTGLLAEYELGRLTRDQVFERLLGMAGRLKQRADYRALDPDARKALELAESLDAFARELMGPLNLNDPTIRAIIDDVQGKGRRAVNAAGFGGGMAEAAVAKGVGDAALSLHSQRQALGASIMGQRLRDQRELNMLKDQAARMQLEQDYQNQLAEWESQRGFGQMLAGGLGAVAGGLIGSLGGPMGALAGANAGLQIGSGLGGAAYGGPPAAPVYRSRFYGGSGRMGY